MSTECQPEVRMEVNPSDPTYGAKVFFAATAPTLIDNGLNLNDLWFNSADGDKLMIWNGAAWEDVSDARIVAGAAAIVAEQAARAAADSALASTDATLADADTALGVLIDDESTRAEAAEQDLQTQINGLPGGNAGNRVFRQDNAPTLAGDSLISGDLWIDSNDTNKLYRWDGAAFVEVTDTRLISTIAGLADVASRVVTRPNLVPNGGFENGVVGWTEVGTASVPLQAVDYYMGRAAKWVSSNTPNSYIYSPIFPVIAGNTYVLTADTRFQAAGGTVLLRIRWFTAGGALISDSDSISRGAHIFSTNNTNRDLWQFQATAPATAAQARVFYVSTGTGTTDIAIRQIKMEAGVLPATPYTAEGQLIATTDILNGVSAHWGVTIDGNGNVIGLIKLDGSTSGSTFTVAADKFYIVDPAHPTAGFALFTVFTSGAIKELIAGAPFRSSNYVLNTAGFRIDNATGNAEFNQITIRSPIIYKPLPAVQFYNDYPTPFNDGQSFAGAPTRWDSISANFSTADIGKTIVSAAITGGSTTIAGVVSATRAALTGTTTGSASGQAFTILKRALNSRSYTDNDQLSVRAYLPGVPASTYKIRLATNQEVTSSSPFWLNAAGTGDGLGPDDFIGYVQNDGAGGAPAFKATTVWKACVVAVAAPLALGPIATMTTTWTPGSIMSKLSAPLVYKVSGTRGTNGYTIAADTTFVGALLHYSLDGINWSAYTAGTSVVMTDGENAYFYASKDGFIDSDYTLFSNTTSSVANGPGDQTGSGPGTRNLP